MGNFNGGSCTIFHSGGEKFDFALEKPKAAGVVLLAVGEDNLSSEADTEEWFSRVKGILNNLVKAGSLEVGHGASCLADAWKNDPIGTTNNIG